MVGKDKCCGAVGFVNHLLQRGPCLHHQVGYRAGRGVRRCHRSTDVLPTVGQRLNQARQRVDSLRELRTLVAQGTENGVQVGDDLTDQVVAVGELVGKGGGLAEERANGVTLTLEGADQLTGQCVHLIRIQGAEQRTEAADQRIQIQSRRGAGQRNGVACGENPRAACALLQCHIASTDQVVVSDHGPGALSQHDGGIRTEHDFHRVVRFDRHRLDLADLDAGDPDELSILQPRDVREVSVVEGLPLESQLAEDREHRKREEQAHHSEDH